MRKVAITGMGIVSCLGNGLDEVSSALRAGRSGIRHLPEAAERGLRSQVGGAPEVDLEARIDRKLLRFMGDAAAYAYLALQAAINLGVNMGVLPTKGLTLPLVSYGRSSLLVTLAALGLLLRIDLENRGIASATKRRVNGRVAP